MEYPTTKRCSACGPQPSTNFHRSLTAGDGLQPRCKTCQRTDNRKRRAALRAKRLASAPAAVTGVTEESYDVDLSEPDDVLTDAQILQSQGDHLGAAYAKRAEDRTKRDLKREHSALLEENETLKQTVGELVKMQRAPDILVYQKPEAERSDATACAIFSDWHVDEPVKKEDVHGLNEYAPEIARTRAQHAFANLLRLTDITARDSVVKTIFMFWGGDFFSGYIHEELLASTAMAPGDAAHFAKGLLMSGVDFLLKESSYTLEIDGIPGNHGRMTDKVWSSDPTGTSLETFMYHAIADKYADNPRVKFRVADKAMLYRKFYEKYVVREIHGYEINYGGGVGGITIPIKKAVASWNYPIVADSTWLGHFHQFMDVGDALVNGSLIGYSNYCQRIKAKYEDPKQAFVLISARNGGEKSIVAPIWLDAARKSEAA